ncbi:MAG: SDR family NAD(P)-dependent oxidoreductase [Acidimicrobiia bacterium]|nr:SDR family NAD(P)-dependent oxidoreductase [Acidimicrobiia bacterium]
MSGPTLLTKILDRSVVLGLPGFTNAGYWVRSRFWDPIEASMDGKVVVITGATSGLGYAAAGGLARLGARVVLVARNPEKADEAQARLQADTGNENIGVELADLSLMRETRDLAGRLARSYPAIDVLVNNVGILPDERQMTDEGIELTLATNLVSHFLLTNLLVPNLETAADPARVINVSSGGMYTQGIRPDNLQYERGEFDGKVAYARTKRGQVVLTEMWAEKLAGRGIVVHAMHPGWADTPGVETSLPGFYKAMKPLLRTPEQGADTIVWLAAADEPADSSGLFWLDRSPHVTNIRSSTETDDATRRELWDRLVELSGWDGDL